MQNECDKNKNIEKGTQNPELAMALPRDDQSERLVLGRLIRRLRISDPPEHFQSVATTVLRTSLNMSAVVWVPKESYDSIVVSGSVDGLDLQAYRDLPSPIGPESTLISGDEPEGRRWNLPSSVAGMPR